MLGAASRGLHEQTRPHNRMIPALPAVRKYAVILAFATQGKALLGALEQTPEMLEPLLLRQTPAPYVYEVSQLYRMIQMRIAENKNSRIYRMTGFSPIY